MRNRLSERICKADQPCPGLLGSARRSGRPPHTFLGSEPGEDRVFRGSFRVARGDSFSPPLADPNTAQFRERARNYRERLNVLFRRSPVRTGFVGTEVLALDGVEGEDLVVHFTLRFDSYYGANVAVPDLLHIMHAVTVNGAPILDGLEVDPKSLLFREEGQGDLPTAPRTSTTPATTTTTEPPPPRRCAPVGLDYCRRGLPYNATSYPNVLGHKDIAALREDVIAFRELVDAECYRLAFEFVCQALQPECILRARGGKAKGPAKGTALTAADEDLMVPPCRSFCRDFMAGCGSRVPSRFREALQCSRFPEYSGPGSCADRPAGDDVTEVTSTTPVVAPAPAESAAPTGAACVAALRAGPHASRICDGVPDCPDLADEAHCSYCPRAPAATPALHCGVAGAGHCVHQHQRCDAKRDCPGGADERHCLSVAPHLSAVTGPAPARHLSPARYHSEGYVVFNEKGETGKVCTENLNATVPAPNREATLNTIATSLCAALSYQKVDAVRVQLDEERTERYVLMEDPTAAEITFVPAPCPKREVLYVACSQIECGVRAAGVGAPSRLAAPGDWPWHAALHKDGAHVCDATLVSAQWLLTASACFQGQGQGGPVGEWVARVGSVRLASRSPWQQERVVLAHRRLESPAEGSALSLLRLAEPFALSDAVRPVCLPDTAPPAPGALCTTLGWGGDALRRVEVRVGRCENATIMSVNALCADKAHHADDCEAEELAGGPLVCQSGPGRSWALAGVGNWRVACTKTPSAERPRVYDKVSSNLEWIRRTLREDEPAGSRS
ncbi:hypothetical protein ONE63_000813 [Megalurothrips usitatus]|uniref:Atrial natriuretic peptide-converting enzyme n=1 Tax=Megalurothrips usitatus TaxID=439358 RepID=A0AAV7Y6F6_9NEOP|nr:hypothetical protein ONE63_000813 [Megalurothrips usitatus]